jgi:hypothetical protein
MVNLPPEIWISIGELATFVYGEVETNFRDPFVAPPQFDIAVGVQKVIPTRQSLVLVSKFFFTTFTPLLYRSILLEDAKSLRRLVETLKGQRSLDVSQRNGSWIRRLFLNTKRERHWRDLPASGTQDLLEYLPRLQVVGIRGRLNHCYSFPFNLNHSSKELKVIYAPYLDVKLPDHIRSPTDISDAFPNLRHTVIRDMSWDQIVDPLNLIYHFTHLVNPIDPSLHFLHCSTKSIKPFLRDAHTFSSLTIAGITVTSPIDGWSNFGEIAACRVTTLDLSGAEGDYYPHPPHFILQCAAKFSHLETLVINFHVHRQSTGVPAFSKLRHLGLFSPLRQVGRQNMNKAFDRLFKCQPTIFPRLERIRVLQPSVSTHIVQRFMVRIVKWTDQFSSKGVRLENYKGELLSSGIRFSESILVDKFTLLTEAQCGVNIALGNGQNTAITVV